jgi:hypothetical protein
MRWPGKEGYFPSIHLYPISPERRLELSKRASLKEWQEAFKGLPEAIQDAMDGIDELLRKADELNRRKLDKDKPTS